MEEEEYRATQKLGWPAGVAGVRPAEPILAMAVVVEVADALQVGVVILTRKPTRSSVVASEEEVLDDRTPRRPKPAIYCGTRGYRYSLQLQIYNYFVKTIGLVGKSLNQGVSFVLGVV